MLVAYTDRLHQRGEARMISPRSMSPALRIRALIPGSAIGYNPDTRTASPPRTRRHDRRDIHRRRIQGPYGETNPALSAETAGTAIDLSLKEAVGSKDFQIAFRTHNYISYDMHVD